MGEGFQVVLQRAGFRLVKPLDELRLRAGWQIGVPRFLGQFDDGGRPQTAVEVVMQQHRGQRHGDTVVKPAPNQPELWHDWMVSEMYVGKLLVATPQLIDPNFFRSVVLVLQHEEDGCVGVVLNRSTVARVADHLPDWAELSSTEFVHYGGPVEPEVAIGLGNTDQGMESGLAGLSLVDLGRDPPHHNIAEVRIFSGYAGWGAGQLEAEIAIGSWYVVDAFPDDAFGNPDGQWRRVLQRQPGTLSLVATYPEDVTLN